MPAEPPKQGTMVGRSTGCGALQPRSAGVEEMNVWRMRESMTDAVDRHCRTPAEPARCSARVRAAAARPSGSGRRGPARVELALVGEDRRQQNHDLRRQDDGCWTVHRARRRPGAAVRLPRARRLGPARGRPVQPGQAAPRPVRAGDHQRGRLRRADPRPHRRLGLRGRPPGLLRRGSAERRRRRFAPAAIRCARPVPLADTVLYELHVKGYTQLHPAVPEHLRGSYAGLAYPAVIEHLLDLGSPRSSCCRCSTSCPSRS